MPEPQRRKVEFDRLNPIGKAIYLTGSAVRVASDFLDFTLRTAGTVLTEAEAAFREGLSEEDGEDISDARVVDETPETETGRP